MKNYKSLQTWQDAIELYKNITPIFGTLRKEKYFRLLDQLEGSTGSVADNIAEGQARKGNKEFLYFLRVAKGSLQECDSQLNRIKILNICEESQMNNLLEKSDALMARIQSLINYLNAHP